VLLNKKESLTLYVLQSVKRLCNALQKLHLVLLSWQQSFWPNVIVVLKVFAMNKAFSQWKTFEYLSNLWPVEVIVKVISSLRGLRLICMMCSREGLIRPGIKY